MLFLMRLRACRPCLASLLALSGFLALPLSGEASRLVVPDDVGTIQEALDAAPETVLVRPGQYAEVPIVQWPVHLDELLDGDPAGVHVLGLRMTPAAVLSTGATFTVARMNIDGELKIDNAYEVVCAFKFIDCTVRDGVRDDYSFYLATRDAEFIGCQIANGVEIRVDRYCTLDTCVVRGGLTVGDGDAVLTIANSEFIGDGSGTAIQAKSYIWSAQVRNSRIHDYVYGIELWRLDGSAEIVGNQIANCLGRGVDVGPNNVSIIGNRVSECSNGIIAVAYEHAAITDNVVSNCSIGLFIYLDAGSIERNAAYFCGNDGLRLSSYQPQGIRVASNNSCFNAGSGIVSDVVYDGDDYAVVRNIAYRNDEYGMKWHTPRVNEVGCNDWFGNGLGETFGREPSSGDIAVEPMFCDTVVADFHLNNASPLLDWAGCGLIGAFGEGCDLPTPTEVATFKIARVALGVELRWRVEGAGSDLVWVERAAEAAGPWLRVGTERRTEGDLVVDLDGSAMSDRTYWYRLLLNEENGSRVLGSALVAQSSTPVEFAIGAVEPNPSRGPVRIEFVVPRQAAVALEVFDVQGRKVASLLDGLLQAGAHRVAWPGSAGRTPMAAGMYMIRFRFPGGQDLRRIVIAR